MHSALHIEQIETVFKNLSEMLNVSFDIRDSQGHPINSVSNKTDDGILYRELFKTISNRGESHMVTNSKGEAIWGIPIITNGNMQDSFVVIHRKPTAIISVLDTDGDTTIARIQQTAERAIITLVEDVLHLVTYRHESEHELDSMAAELSIRYEELNFFYKIGRQLINIENYEKALQYILTQTIELLNADYATLHLPSKDILTSISGNGMKIDSDFLSHEIISLTPKLCALFHNGNDYFTEGNSGKQPSLMKFAHELKRFLIVPVNLHEEKIGIVLLGRCSSNKPFSISDKRLLNVVADMMAMKISNSELFIELKELSLNLMKSFTETIEEKDPYTRGHSERVNELSLKIGKALELNPDQMQLLNFTSILHDIGKIGIPEDILKKPEKLSDKEYALIKEHTIKGYKILLPIKQLNGCLDSILYHHERIDGKGYPQGLSGDQIPLFARIIAVADTFDAMTSHRAYRKAKKMDEVIQELKDVSGKQLDADITRVFITKCLGINI
jgi:HD-GYP domain-containing protein (c-di-GMP phosphodiesterase class II)